MPTKTPKTPRRAPAPTGRARISRPGVPARPASRRPTMSAVPRLPSRAATKPARKGKKGSPSGVAGLMTGAMSALPIPGTGKSKSRFKLKGKAGGGSKAKPAFALLAAGASAVLSRKRMKKRSAADETPETFAATPPVNAVDNSTKI